jgi:hypothetical protein
VTGSPRQTVERFLEAAVSPTPGDMADCYAERFVIEMPFAAGLAPERTRVATWGPSPQYPHPQAQPHGHRSLSQKR